MVAQVPLSPVAYAAVAGCHTLINKLLGWDGSKARLEAEAYQVGFVCLGADDRDEEEMRLQECQHGLHALQMPATSQCRRCAPLCTQACTNPREYALASSVHFPTVRLSL